MQAPYGTWSSPISAELVATAANALLSLSAEDNAVYWLEMRPEEGGRYVLVKGGSGQPVEVAPSQFNLRSRVHEYGGASYRVHNNTLYFTNFADQALYRQSPSTAAARLTASDGLRYADCDVHPDGGQLVCVREDHRGDAEPLNQIVLVPLPDTGAAPGDGNVIWSGGDFVAYPRFSADGSSLAWISWDHPNMPWDSVSLWVAGINAAGQLQNPVQLNPGEGDSVLQPTWAEDGTLYFLSDRSGWWNLHRWRNGSVSAVHQTEAELGDALWTLGNRYFALHGNKQALISLHNEAGQKLALLSLDSGEHRVIDLPFVSYDSLAVAGNTAYFIAGRHDQPAAVVALDLNSDEHRIIHEAGDAGVPAAYISTAQALRFPTPGGYDAHAYYYPPRNADYRAPEGERPPLMVVMHGGPTGATSAAFSIAKQFWTSRGIAVIDVNYSGSTGYGRTYRNRLRGAWGEADVADAIAATRYAVDAGLADPDRLLIRGGSAGGFTTLAALAAGDVFAAGANYYGVSDLEVLARDTHKFESRYLDSLIGPYPAQQQVYKARSPINNLQSFTSPLITLQGLDDQIVPPNQSEMIFQALVDKGVPSAYLTFAGEQHGFRKAASITAALEAELYFYGKVLGFAPSGKLMEIDIVNL